MSKEIINKDVTISVNEEDGSYILNINGQLTYLSRREMVELITFVLMDAMERFKS